MGQSDCDELNPYPARYRGSVTLGRFFGQSRFVYFVDLLNWGAENFRSARVLKRFDLSDLRLLV